MHFVRKTATLSLHLYNLNLTNNKLYLIIIKKRRTVYEVTFQYQRIIL